MEPVKIINSKSVVLPLDDIDTDQIIPARFLTTTSKEGLGKNLFNDWRFDSDGLPIKEFILNQSISSGCEILVTGRNFGCGSSREHAPWALLDYGIKAVISTEIADIFFNNSLKNGFIPIRIDEDSHNWLLSNPGVKITIDISELSVNIDGYKKIDFYMDPFSKYCLLNGIDQLGFIMKHENQIKNYEGKLGE
ncbi:MAG: 3-isopropylmalate dehydratase small subunit [Pseudomonadota bacterium]|nr:3-isopropylmalate dehydratase small subunit [Pseudomonadota bacterium]|tara:strand:+ start:2235 stop:2813 length:579 start_codon:yes stop_codon:yes gene_type:complete